MKKTSPLALQVASSVVSLKKEYGYAADTGNVYTLHVGLNTAQPEGTYNIVKKGLIELGAHFHRGQHGSKSDFSNSGPYTTRDPSKFLMVFGFQDRPLLQDFIKDVKRIKATLPTPQN